MFKGRILRLIVSVCFSTLPHPTPAPLSHALPSEHIPHLPSAPLPALPLASRLSPPSWSLLQPRPSAMWFGHTCLLKYSVSPGSPPRGQAGAVTLLISEMRKLMGAWPRSVSYKWQNQDSKPGRVAQRPFNPSSPTVRRWMCLVHFLHRVWSLRKHFSRCFLQEFILNMGIL